MKHEDTMGEDLRDILKKCLDPEKAEQVALWLKKRCEEEHIVFVSYAWKSLVNHITAMVNRSVTGETLDIDTEVFEDVPEDSLRLAQEVVNAVGKIQDEEKYLLSIHFESAKENAQKRSVNL